MSIRVHEFQPRPEELEIVLSALQAYETSDYKEEEKVDILIEEISSILQDY